MPHAFTTTRRVEFAETDMAGIAHFSNFFRWMESAEHEFFRSLGFALHGEVDGRTVGFARVHASCDYRRPVRYQDLLEIRLAVTKKSSRSFAYAFRFHLKPEDAAADPEPIATGELAVVCVERPPAAPADVPLAASTIPDSLAARIEVAPVS